MVEGLRLEGGHSQSGEWEERDKNEERGEAAKKKKPSKEDNCCVCEEE